ncbi:hypothetical protein JCM10207_007006 [Rhodosporidiobolus poonsookiae]
MSSTLYQLRKRYNGPAVLVPLVVLGSLALLFSHPTSPSYDALASDPAVAARTPSWYEYGLKSQQRAAKKEADALMDKLLHVPAEEVGRVAICASIHDEGRWLHDWIIYNRVVGVDRFYLYDTGSTDNTLEVLQPWMEAGIVKLHKFNNDLGSAFQSTALITCSKWYGPKTEWLLSADVDEFFVVPHSLTGSVEAMSSKLSDMPRQPLWNLLKDTPLYQDADVLAVSRMTFKNAGLQRLPDHASILAAQHSRDFLHSVPFTKLTYIKPIVHTRSAPGWFIPGAHEARHDAVARSDARLISVDGQPVETRDSDPGATTPQGKGTMYGGTRIGRSFEPLVMYHYQERDLDNCLEKFARVAAVQKDSWRAQAGGKACTGAEMYSDDESFPELRQQHDFYVTAVPDYTMSNSWYGRHIPVLIRSAVARADALARGAKSPTDLPHQPDVVDPHPWLIENWTMRGLNPINGRPLNED